MKIYLFIYLIVSLICIIGILKKSNRLYKYLELFIISIASLRFDTGFDYFLYWMLGDKNYSGYIYYDILYDKMEFFFKRVYDLVRYFEKPELFFIITSILTFFLIFKHIKNETKNIYFVTCYFISTSYFFKFSLFFVRQALAVAITMVASELILKKKKSFLF